MNEEDTFVYNQDEIEIALEESQVDDDPPFCKTATRTLVKYALKGMLRSTYDQYSEGKSLNRALSLIIGKVDITKVRQLAPFNAQLPGPLDQAQMNAMVKAVFDHVYDTVGSSRMTFEALRALPWMHRFFASAIIPTKFTAFREGTIPIEVPVTNFAIKGTGLGGQGSATYFTDMQFAMITFNGACFINYT